MQLRWVFCQDPGAFGKTARVLKKSAAVFSKTRAVFGKTRAVLNEYLYLLRGGEAYLVTSRVTSGVTSGVSLGVSLGVTSGATYFFVMATDCQ